MHDVIKYNRHDKFSLRRASLQINTNTLDNSKKIVQHKFITVKLKNNTYSPHVTTEALT